MLSHHHGLDSKGPNPVGFWLDSDFWTSGFSGGHSSSSSPWGSFGGRPRPQKQSRPHQPRQRKHPPSKKIFVGDQHQCGVGSCEFFLFCWLGNGIVSGSCGGFLFACCQRTSKGAEVYIKQVSPQNEREKKQLISNRRGTTLQAA
jgi:hypothetical protein